MANINIAKSLTLMGLISSIFIFSAVLLSAYPQHLYLDNNTVIESTVGYFHNGTANIRGNQIQYSTGDTIPLEDRDFIIITGNQAQIGGSTFISAIRSVSTNSLSQNVLFEQQVGSFGINNAGKLIIDDMTMNFIPVTPNILGIKTSDSNYNVEFINDITYIKSKNIILKLLKKDNDIKIYLVGTQSFNKILFVKI